jgi:hypothetical protein
MNTTSLIREWSMSGAKSDVADRFRVTDDIHSILVGGSAAASLRHEVPLLLKLAGEGDWHPLAAGVGEEDGGRA